MKTIIEDPKIKEALDLINQTFKDKKEEMQKVVSDKYVDMRDAISNVKNEATGAVQKNPWMFLGGIALSFLLLGYFMGHSKE